MASMAWGIHPVNGWYKFDDRVDVMPEQIWWIMESYLFSYHSYQFYVKHIGKYTHYIVLADNAHVFKTDGQQYSVHHLIYGNDVRVQHGENSRFKKTCPNADLVRVSCVVTRKALKERADEYFKAI